MRVNELFRTTELSRDDVLLRMKNSKSKEEKEKWAAFLVKHRYALHEEGLPTYLARLVNKQGIKMLGGGAFSQVFQHPHYGNVVVKVYTDKDTVYKKYVSWCLRHQGNPYVPKIIEQVKYKSPDTGDKYNIVFLQKMTPIKTVQKLITLLVKALNLNTKAAEDLPFMTAFGQQGREAQDFRLIDKYVKKGRADKDFTEVWNHIRTYGADKFDLHPGNVMLRDGQLVLTDPVANDPTSRVDEL